MKVLWLKDSKAGHLNKVRGLLRALEAKVALEVVECELDWYWSGSRQLLSRLGSLGFLLPLRWFLREVPALEGVDLVLSSGGATQWPNAALARRGGVANVFLGSPRKMDPAGFSLIALHDPPRETPPFFRFHLIPSLVTPLAARSAAREAGIAEGEQWGLLIGGHGEGITWREEDYLELTGTFLAAARKAATGVWLASSRRTPPQVEAKLRALAEESGLLRGACWYHDARKQPVSLLAMMGACSRLCVTADSMSMTHEAISTGRPVISVSPAGEGNPRLVGNLEKLAAAGFLVRQSLSNLSLGDAEPDSGWHPSSGDPAEELAEAVLDATGISGAPARNPTS